MSWNPSKEVAVARDAARALDDAPICVVIWVTRDGTKIGVSSYGQTRKLCNVANTLGDVCHNAAMHWGEES